MTMFRMWVAWRHLEPADREMLTRQAEGLVQGMTEYGQGLSARTDRDFVRDALEEVRDGLSYVGAALMRIEDTWDG